jgi:predicted TPR repeat methyltransferase
MATFRSSGDLTADRRYEYARAALEDCDGVAAADLFRQTLELVPDWPPAHFGLGEALALEGDSKGAAAAFARTLELAPEDALGASLRLARLGFHRAEDAMRPGFVAALFDEYAESFDNHLLEALGYRGPDVVVGALQEVCDRLRRSLQFASGLDLGCGTGLMAKALEGHLGAIDGVDLSPRMVAKAKATGLYRNVHAGDATEMLRSSSDRYSLIVAADVFVYIGDLAPLFAAAASALTAEGLFGFTVQKAEGEGFILGGDLRHHHSAHYLRATAGSNGLTIHQLAECITRKDAGEDVPGLVAVLGRINGS